MWLAPEVIQREAYDGKADVYSYGVILWELVAREDFLKDILSPLAIEQAVLQGERPPIPGIYMAAIAIITIHHPPPSDLVVTSVFAAGC